MRKKTFYFLLAGSLFVSISSITTLARYYAFRYKNIDYISYNDKNLTKHPKHVVVLAIDGLASYALEKATIPNIRHMIDHGAFRNDIQAELPNSSAGNWASILLGTSPDYHGVVDQPLTNIKHSVMVDKEKLEKQTSIFGLIYESNHDKDWQLKHDKIQTAYVSLLPVHNKVLEHEFKKYGNDFINFYQKPKNKYESTKYYLDILENQINPTKPSFSWVYFLDPDDTGHSREYNSEEYYQALTKVDKEIGQIVNKLKEKKMYEDTVFIINTDHGGLSQYHGRPNKPELIIPWIVYGKNYIKQRGIIPNGIKVYDTAPTASYLMDLKDIWALSKSKKRKWKGQPIVSPFWKKPNKKGYPFDEKKS